VVLSEESLLLDFSTYAPDTHLQLGLLDNLVQGGFDRVSFLIMIDQQISPLSEVFNTVPMASSFFIDNVLDLGPISEFGPSAIHDLSIELDVTATQQSNGFAINFLVATTVPERLSGLMLAIGVGWLACGAVLRRTARTSLPIGRKLAEKCA
jgi:hypothetical protein